MTKASPPGESQPVLALGPEVSLPSFLEMDAMPLPPREKEPGKEKTREEEEGGRLLGQLSYRQERPAVPRGLS